MCEFISWVERRGKVYFLTGELFETEKGKEFCKTISPDDWSGHGTIRAFFGIDALDGQDKECIDFSSPEKFPAPIIEALKAGKFKGFPFPPKLLNKTMAGKYRADYQPLEDTYEADYKTLEDKYEADYNTLRKTLDDKFRADYQTLRATYVAVCQPLNEKCRADYQTLSDKYWTLVKTPENRNPNWR